MESIFIFLVHIHIHRMQKQKLFQASKHHDVPISIKRSTRDVVKFPLVNSHFGTAAIPTCDRTRVSPDSSCDQNGGYPLN